MKIKNLFVAVATVTLLASCATPKNISYFQDAALSDSAMKVTEPREITVRPKDKLSIIVSCRDSRVSNMFNLPIISQQVGTDVNYNQSRGLSGYTVDLDGNIDFPILGEMKVQGMTREEVAALIKSELVSQDLVKDPVVTVEFMNLAVSVMGEVIRPGRYNIDRDHFTILDAISQAGDLTIFGNRENVLVLRHEGGEQKVYAINLNSAGQIYSSPAYYLQQGDVVYIEPNDIRKRQSTVNGNNVRSTSFWISFASLLTSVATTISVLLK